LCSSNEDVWIWKCVNLKEFFWVSDIHYAQQILSLVILKIDTTKWNILFCWCLCIDIVLYIVFLLFKYSINVIIAFNIDFINKSNIIFYVKMNSHPTSHPNFLTMSRFIFHSPKWLKITRCEANRTSLRYDTTSLSKNKTIKIK